jgi:D-alanine-D-alanine ligase
VDVVEYEPIAVYIAPSGRWYLGEALLDQAFYKRLPDSLNEVDEVVLLPVPRTGGLTVLRKARKSRLPLEDVENEVIPIDVYFPTFHGSYGEDGCIQGLLELAEVPYTGCGVLASALSMSKQHCKDVVSRYGVPVLPSLVLVREKVQADLGKGFVKAREAILTSEGFRKFPLFVKPCTLGSSIGVARVTNVAELDAALLQAFKYDWQVMVEPCLEKKLEINVSVLDGEEIVASVPEIPISAAGQELTYEDKYLRGGGKKGGGEAQGMAALTRSIDPPDLSDDLKKQARGYAIAAFTALGCSGVARIDFMLDLNNEKLYFNEINPIPGSLSFYLWAGSRPAIFYTDLLTRIIKRAQRTFQEKTTLNRDFGFRALVK